jgi:nucleoside phosphorylase
MKTPLCLIVAADIEYKAAAEVLDRLDAQEQIVLLKTGIGAIRFRDRCAPALKAGNFKQVVVTGLCGALDAELRKGDAVVYDEVRSVKGSLKLDHDVADRLARSVECARGTGLSVERVVTRASEKEELRLAHGAIAVDMETYEVASFCMESGIAVGVMRVVSDEAHEDLPDFNGSLDERGEMVGWKLAQRMLVRPRASMRLIAGYKSTMESFRSALESVVRSLS